MRIQYRRDLWKLLALNDLRKGVAELGVAEGFFSADMLNWPINIPFLYMVDRWQCCPDVKGDSAQKQSWHDKNYAAAMSRTASQASRRQVLRGDTITMASHVLPGSLSLVYVDADHSYNAVTADIQAWRPKLEPGGIMAFHDYLASAYGVQKAVRRYADIHGLEIVDLPEDKTEDAGAYFILPK